MDIERIKKLINSSDLANDRVIGAMLYIKKFGIDNFFRYCKSVNLQNYYFFNWGGIWQLLEEFVPEGSRAGYQVDLRRDVIPDKYKHKYRNR